MRPDLADELRRDGGISLVKKLARLYHYYANPDSCPAFNINEALAQGALGRHHDSARSTEDMHGSSRHA
jgi:hypothetical protein